MTRFFPISSVLLGALALIASAGDIQMSVAAFADEPGSALKLVTWGAFATVGSVWIVGRLLRCSVEESVDSPTSRWMGAMERLAIFTLLLLSAPKAVGALVIFKTAIRWTKFDEEDGHHFAEAFFLAMLFNLGIASVSAWMAGADLSTLP